MEEINKKIETLLRLDNSIDRQELGIRISKHLEERGEAAVLAYLDQRIALKKNPPDMRSIG